MSQYIDGMSNEEYHKPEHGYSTSVLKAYMDDPASVVWGRNAEQDKEKLSAIDFGTDFHSYFLEPELFKRTYKVLPVFNRRKPAEKQAELDMIEEWKSAGIIPVTNEDMAKLEAMRNSALANPTVDKIMNLNGIAERSFFWTDEETGLNLKCRPDWLVTGIDDSNRIAFMPNDCDTLVMDVKTIAGLDRIQTQIETLKYYVQDPFYTAGVEKVTGGKVCFVFVFVSTTMELGRYPVRCVVLSDVAKFSGEIKMREALNGLANQDNWDTVVTMDRPNWAVRAEENDIY